MFNFNNRELLDYKGQILTGIFLLFLAASGNFIGETFTCKFRELLSTNMVAKHILIIIILYFSINFSNKEDAEHPIKNLYTTLKIYLLFILFSKMNIYFTIFTLLLLAIVYALDKYITYIRYNKKNNNKDEKNEKLIENLILLSDSLIIFIILCILLGFTLYLYQQYSDHKKNWSICKFIFGSIKCDH